MEKPKKSLPLFWSLTLIVILVIAGGVYFFYFKKSPSPSLTSSSVATTTPPTVGIYTNGEYGFTFDYPSGWQITESADKQTVTVDAGITTNGLDALSLVFTIIDDNSFEPVQTKVGDISYDPSQNTLVDTNEIPERCLPTADLQGLAGGLGTLPAINYGGSIMSDPAYWENAILTNKNYMLDVGESYERPMDDATNAILQAGENKIYSSLNFINGVSARTPACASSSQ